MNTNISAAVTFSFLNSIRYHSTSSEALTPLIPAFTPHCLGEWEGLVMSVVKDPDWDPEWENIELPEEDEDGGVCWACQKTADSVCDSSAMNKCNK